MELVQFGKVQRAHRAAVDDTEAQIDLRNAVLITVIADVARNYFEIRGLQIRLEIARKDVAEAKRTIDRSEEHTSELQSPDHLVCRLLLEKKKKNRYTRR